MATDEYFVNNETAGINHATAFETSMKLTTSPPFDYHYATDYESDDCDQRSLIDFGANLTVIFLSFVIFFSLFGNLLVLVILFKYENVKSITNTLILNLAVSDLFFTLGLPFWAYYHIDGWTLGEPACQVVSFIFFLGFYSSGFFLILMTIHRYIAVMNPLSSVVSTTGPSGILTAVLAWIVSILAATPVFIFIKVEEIKHKDFSEFGYGDGSSQIPKYFCEYGSSFATKLGIYEQNVLFVLTALVFVFCYSQIVCRLLRPTAQRRRNKTVKLIFILMLVFFLGWGPYNIVIFLKSLRHGAPTTAEDSEKSDICGKHKTLEYAFYVSRLVAFSHCCLNPVFYVFAGVKFKSHLKKLLQNLCHSKNRIPTRERDGTITSFTSGNEFQCSFQKSGS
ncbi:chemokine XC receptor 1-like [Fundulus diaphanus]